LYLPGIQPPLTSTTAALLELVTSADRAGIDLVSTGDHLGFGAAAHAQRVTEQGFPFPLDHAWLEPLVLLAAIAARTTRIRLGVSILIAPLRPAVLLAKQAATLDVISGGRLVLGVGAGWQAAEYEAAGVPFAGRFDRLEQTVAAARELWTHAPASFTGPGFWFEDFYSLPQPQQPRLRVIFGVGATRSGFARIARAGDGWAVNPRQTDTFATDVRGLWAAFEDHGRDPQTAEVHVSLRPVLAASGGVDFTATAESGARLREAGATTLLISPHAFGIGRDEFPELLDWLVALRAALPPRLRDTGT
jgi:probable F420-dependent oxidoreductase